MNTVSAVNAVLCLIKIELDEYIRLGYGKDTSKNNILSALDLCNI